MSTGIIAASRLRGSDNNPFGGGETYLYQLNDTGSIALDQINGFNGVLEGGVTNGIAGKIGNCFNFPGTSLQGVVMDDFTGTAQGSYSLFVWLKFTATNTQLIISNQVNNSNTHIYLFVSSGNLNFQIFYSSRITLSFPLTDINDNNWHRLVVRHKINDFADIHLDNVLKDSTTISTSNFLPSTDNSGALVLGRRSKNSNSFFYNGLMDQVIYNKNNVVTLQEINEDWNNGNGKTY